MYQTRVTGTPFRCFGADSMASSTEFSSASCEKRGSFFSNLHFLKAADLPRRLQMRHRKKRSGRRSRPLKVISGRTRTGGTTMVH
jgi:hypothetical protein